ncbi:TPA: hypothetical protein ACLHMP_003699 [Acinetobacter baumannii]
MKKITLRDTESNKELCIVKKSYNLSNLNDQKWYLSGSQELFNEDPYVLEQLDEIKAGNDLKSRDDKKIYSVISVGQ